MIVIFLAGRRGTFTCQLQDRPDDKSRAVSNELKIHNLSGFQEGTMAPHLLNRHVHWILFPLITVRYLGATLRNRPATSWQAGPPILALPNKEEFCLCSLEAQRCKTSHKQKKNALAGSRNQVLCPSGPDRFPVTYSQKMNRQDVASSDEGPG